MYAWLSVQRLVGALAVAALVATVALSSPANAQDDLDLMVATPEEGFELAVQLARRGVVTTQPDRDVLAALREAYASDPALLIASSEVVAIHFSTIAAANDYWRDR